jgi:hypothetical protein
MAGPRERIHRLLSWARYRWELHKRREAARQMHGTQTSRWPEGGTTGGG